MTDSVDPFAESYAIAQRGEVVILEITRTLEEGEVEAITSQLQDMTDRTGVYFIVLDEFLKVATITRDQDIQIPGQTSIADV